MTPARPRRIDSNAQTYPAKGKPFTCPRCERRVVRRSRQQLYCSTRCRKSAHYRENGRTGVIFARQGVGSGLGTNPPKKQRKNNGLQVAKFGSSPRILGPRHVIQDECFGRYSWQPSISSEGVEVEVAQLRPRVLMS